VIRVIGPRNTTRCGAFYWQYRFALPHNSGGGQTDLLLRANWIGNPNKRINFLGQIPEAQIKKLGITNRKFYFICCLDFI
jgi:hypothetical protein